MSQSSLPTRTLRVKRPQKGVMIDGTYEVTAYWSDSPLRQMTTKAVVVKEGVASWGGGIIFDPFTQSWLADHHIPSFCPLPRKGL